MTDGSIRNQLKESIEVVTSSASRSDEANQFASAKLEKLAKDQAFVNTICTQLLDGHKTLFSDLKGDQAKTSEIGLVCKDILSRIETLKRDFEQNKRSLEELTKLTELNKGLEENKTTVERELADLKKGHQNLQSHMEQVKLDLTKARDSSSSFESEVQRLEDLLKSKESTLKLSDQKIQKCKATCESKIRTQLEIHKLIGDQRDKLKTELENKVSI